MLQLLSKFAQADQSEVARIAQENAVSPMMAAALYARGLRETDDIQAFLHPSLAQLHDPFLLPDMQAAVDRIRFAVQEQESIAVYGDYDVDGICATAIMTRYLSAIGAAVRYFIPSRHTDGYGMNEKTVRMLAEDGVKLIVTVDNGVSAKPEIALAYALGMEVVVTDHHQCPDKLPECAAVIDAEREGSRYPFSKLCGAGVALKLVQALGCEEITPYLALAALATVADVVPLLNENRVIVAEGIKNMPSVPGIMALLSAAGCGENAIDSDMLLFRAAPRLNAAGRMGDAARGVQLLLCKNKEEALPIALELNGENEKRQAAEQEILKSANAQLKSYDLLQNRAILLYGVGWNPGVIGIVASRLAEAYYKPVILFSLEGDCLTGSGRSIPGVNLYECLNAFSARFIRFGGHAQAAGLTMAHSAFAGFFEDFNTYLADHIPEDAFVPTRYYDMETEIRDLTMGVANEFAQLAPFGEGNPQPVFCTRSTALTSIRRVGKTGSHLQATAVQRGWRAPVVAFHLGEQAEALAEGECYDLLFTPSINEYKQHKSIQLLLKCAKDVSFFADEGYVTRRSYNFYDAFFRNVMYTSSRGVSHEAVAAKDADETLVTALKKSRYGTLVLCGMPQEALRLQRLLLDCGLAQCIDVSMESCGQGGYNALVLAPDLCGLTATGFGQAFFYGFTAMPEVSVPQSVYASIPRTCGDAFFAPLKANRETAKQYFSAYGAVLRNGEAALEELLLAAERLEGREAGLLWLSVFCELGFYVFNEQEETVSRVNGCENKPLSNSSIYSAALAAMTTAES
ncbi:MAG: single-stranded-DNA-specific exonuclease RecJ [Eubacteriales bacterium]|nr:single-stranded-DNA-specific exonuclease RecJ [Eubacteriales bacterium]